MKKTIIWAAATTSILSAIFFSMNDKGAVIDNSAIHWYTIEEALAANEDEPKKLFIDMYTDWCGWCKVMDKKTFTDAEVIKTLNENYYPVKFNAEQKEPVVFNGKSYEYMGAGRRGVHGLAYTLLDQRPSYPSFVILDENLNRQSIIKGYLTPDRFLPQIR